ncbi:uncharacterized protein DS421_7g205280 [Arachis hypogaea]|nr:uncharacterized protein DS421_7g205280 [Arachis hypogaea]
MKTAPAKKQSCVSKKGCVGQNQRCKEKAGKEMPTRDKSMTDTPAGEVIDDNSDEGRSDKRQVISILTFIK